MRGALSLALILCAAGSAWADEWYVPVWMARASHAPVFRVRDTEGSLAPLARETKVVTLRDLVLAHGHACDGLVLTACALAAGLPRLFPDGIVDRTDACCLTNNSPCFGDVASYVTGGRIRFGTQKVDPSLGRRWILHRPSTGTTVTVSLRDGVFPRELGELEARIRGGDRDRIAVLRCRRMQDGFARRMIERDSVDCFDVEEARETVWTPDAYPGRGPRGDILLRDFDEGKGASR